MSIPTEARRRAFSVWLRTGRLPAANGVEVKFNPWHDPENGRFTFVGTGRHYGPGERRSAQGQSRKIPRVEYTDDLTKAPITSVEEANAWRAEQIAKNGHKPGYREAIERRYRQYLSQFTPRRDKRPAPVRNVQSQPRPSARPKSRAEGGNGFRGDGGSFGGGGASGSWDESPAQAARQTGEVARATGVGQRGDQSSGRSESGKWRKVWSNGYLYEIDTHGRTRRVSGELAENPNQKRSRKSQRGAGGSDRRPTDEGGHYIARRFNGPTEAFNHFAQDRNFNHEDYARLEEQWARAKRLGKKVRVKIAPVYEGDSQRPSVLNVWFWIDGNLESHRFPNEPKGKKNAE